MDFENKKLKNKGLVSEKDRSKVSFECGKTGFFLTLFFHHLHSTIRNVLGAKSKIKDLANILDSNSGCLSSEIENKFQ